MRMELIQLVNGQYAVRGKTWFKTRYLDLSTFRYLDRERWLSRNRRRDIPSDCVGDYHQASHAYFRLRVRYVEPRVIDNPRLRVVEDI